MADMDMECDICSHTLGGRRKPLCACCAQTILYGPRIQQATALLDREKSHTHAEAVIRPGNDGVLAALPDDADFDAITSGIKRNSLERTNAEREAAENRVSHIMDKAEELRKQIEEYKEQVQAQKKDMERRRRELAGERTELDKARPRALDPVEAATKKALQRVDKTHSRTIEARRLLCRELAAAANLQRHKNPRGKSEYSLGGLVLPDLLQLNVKTQTPAKPATVGGRKLAEPHDRISEALDNVARLVNLSAHYLSVRLPAEIILPHEDFPRTVIMHDKSSYKSRNVPFPTIAGPGMSRNSSPAASRVLEQSQLRPRHLWLDRPLAQLHKEDNKTYGLFVEGVTLLAWNLAYLCRTQGIDNINTFEETCNIGRNLWRLLMTQNRRPSERPQLDRNVTGLTNATDAGRGNARLGVFSHDSAQHNLAGWEGLDLMQDWKLASSARMMDKLKSHLYSEISGAEWTLLEEQEWDDDRDDEMPVFVGGSRLPQESRHPAMSVMSVAPHHDGTEDENADGKRKGSSGWMKVRGRNPDA